jgi:aspartyl-tRNA(Asn)/glutamyl-tRNA(Gln) amidotransferase subunit C
LRKDCAIAISREEVLHVAQLAQLALSEDEIERLTNDLDKILEAVGIVSELDLEHVQPTSHPLDLVNVGDDDVLREPLPREDVFANAPAEEAGQFRVPPWRQ